MGDSKSDDSANQAKGCLALIALSLFLYNCGGYWFGKSDEEKAQEVAQKAKVDAEEKRKGFHCLSFSEGAHKKIVADLKPTLRNPEAFQHVETRITPVDQKGFHSLVMSYRAQNGFGGMAMGTMIARVKNADCSYVILSNKTE